jgi:acetyl-CoA carboxylase biotin carboxyl carrier protein
MASKRKQTSKPTAAPSVSSSGLNVDSLRQIVEILESSEVTRLVWRSGGERLTIRRGPIVPAAMHAPTVHYAPAPLAHHAEVGQGSAPPRASASVTSAGGTATASVTPPAAVEKPGTVITSPFVGTFYRTPAPDQPPFVDVGSSVRKGQTLCIIEAMKLMNEIESEVAGKVTEVLAKSGEPVEFGQPLFRIEAA